MSVAIETVIIVIVVVSFTVLGAIVFALYWLWRLLLEDRRCTRASDHFDWNQRPNRLTTILAPQNLSYNAEQTPLTSNRTTAFPRITRSSDVIVDERSLRMARGKREHTPPSPHQRETVPQTTAEVIVLDDTEPPPPYEVI